MSLSDKDRPVPRRKSERRPRIIVVPGPAAPPSRRQPPGWLRRGTILTTLFVLTVAVATVGFWYYAASTGLLGLSENALYFIRNVGLIGLLIGGAGLFIAISSFQRALLPTADLMEAAEHLAAGDYDIELDERGPRELRSLTRTFNYMVTQLRGREQQRRRLQADIAHAIQSSQPQDARHSRLIRDWNRIALAENGELALHPEPTDLVALIREMMLGLHPQVSVRGVALRATLPPPPLIAELDPLAFGEICKSIIIYSLARLSPGGEIRLELSTQNRPSALRFAVSDNGHALGASEIECLFVTLQANPPIGSGLELPFARTMIEAQGGAVSAYSKGESDLTIAFLLPFS